MIMKVFFIALISLTLYASSTPKEIYDSLNPSVVLIEYDEGLGSGILISEDGLIITNYHVINTRFKLSVRAYIEGNKGFVEYNFKDIKILKVHKTYDLALIKIKSDSKFKPAILDNISDPKPGEVCYALGNPTIKNTVFRNAFTKGMVAFPDFKIKDKSYIQNTAPVEPGNSGGALINSKGNVIGVVTSRSAYNKSIAYAIPAKLIKEEDFVEFNGLKEDYNRFNELLDEGYRHFQQFINMSTIYQDRRNFHWLTALYFFREATRYAPSQAGSYHHIGNLFRHIKDNETASRYFKKSLKMKNPLGITCYLQGEILKSQNKYDEAISLQLKGAFLKTSGWEYCTSSIFRDSINKEKIYSAFYMLRYSLLSETFRKNDYQVKLYERYLKTLPDKKLVKRIEAKTKHDDFSLEEFKTLGPADKQYSKLIKETAKTLKNKLLTRTISFDNKLQSALAKVEDLKRGWNSVELLGTLINPEQCYGGKLLIGRLKWQKKVVIIDTVSAKVIGKIDTKSEDYFYSASQDLLHIYYRETNELYSYSLPNLRFIHKSKFDIDGKINIFKVSETHPDKAIMGYIHEKGPAMMTVQDITSLNGFVILNDNKKMSLRSLQNIFLNRSCQVVIIDKSLYKVDLDKMLSKYGSVSNYVLNYDSSNFLISKSGDFIVTQSGNFFNKKTGKDGLRNSRIVGLAYEGTSFLEKSSDKFQLVDINNMNEIRLDDSRQNFEMGSIFYSEKFNRLVNVKEGRVYIKNLISSIMSVTPGKKWVYNLNIGAESEVVIKQSPEGVQVKKGLLIWNVPVKYPPGKKEILLSIKNAEEVEEYKSINILVSPKN